MDKAELKLRESIIHACRSMNGLAILIPIALFLGLCGLAAFFWAMRSGQFEDMDGAGMRILIDEDDQ